MWKGITLSDSSQSTTSSARCHLVRNHLKRQSPAQSDVRTRKKPNQELLHTPHHATETFYELVLRSHHELEDPSVEETLPFLFAPVPSLFESIHGTGSLILERMKNAVFEQHTHPG
ncbi:hypothetical protein ACOME3_006770 [Neoechinorhynchus agilis]